MHMSNCDCPKFWDKIPFKEGRIQDPRNSNFLEKEQNRNFGYKIVISVKNRKFIL